MAGRQPAPDGEARRQHVDDLDSAIDADRAAAGLVLGLLLWSTFYLGWFAIVIGAIGGSIALLLQLLAGDGRRVVTAVIARWRSIVAAVAGFALMMIGFLTTYWSALTESRGRSYDEVLGLAPRPFDIVNVGRDNAAWGWLMRALVGDDPRLVHWPTSARMGTLMIREHVELRRPEFTVLLDAADSVADAEDRKSTRLNSSHTMTSRMPSSA